MDSDLLIPGFIILDSPKISLGNYHVLDSNELSGSLGSHLRGKEMFQNNHTCSFYGLHQSEIEKEKNQDEETFLGLNLKGAEVVGLNLRHTRIEQRSAEVDYTVYLMLVTVSSWITIIDILQWLHHPPLWQP